LKNSIFTNTKNEYFLWQGSPSFITMSFLSWVLLVLTLVCTIFIFLPNVTSLNLNNEVYLSIFTVFACSPMILCCLLLICQFILYYNTCYGITEQRVMFRTGTFFMQTNAINFNNIQNCILSQTPVERLFNTATIRFSTFSESVKFKSIRGYKNILMLSNELKLYCPCTKKPVIPFVTSHDIRPEAFQEIASIFY